jgi:DNA-binding MarR family transcriptional regulator
MHARILRLVKSGNDLSTRQLYVLFECLQSEQTVKGLFDKGAPGLNKPAVTRAIDRLAELKYVTRVDHPTDRRSVLIRLTPAGRKFIENANKT